MARGGDGRVRRHEDQQLPGLARPLRGFLIGLVDWRRPLSLRNLDLLVLLSFSVSLWFFNRGDVFTAMPLVVPGAALAARRAALWIGLHRSRAARRDACGRSGCCSAATIFVAGFRVGLNVRDLERDRRRLLGRDRRRPDLARAEPVRPLPGRGRPAGVRPGRRRRARSATASRRTAAARARTRAATRTAPSRTSPTCPGYLGFGWTGSGTTCPAAHATTIALRPALPARARASSGGGSAGLGSARRSRSPGRRGRSRSTRRTRTRTT